MILAALSIITLVVTFLVLESKLSSVQGLARRFAWTMGGGVALLAGTAAVGLLASGQLEPCDPFTSVTMAMEQEPDESAGKSAEAKDAPVTDKSSPDKSSPDKSSPDKSSPDKSSPDKSSPDKSSPDKSSPDKAASAGDQATPDEQVAEKGTGESGEATAVDPETATEEKPSSPAADEAAAEPQNDEEAGSDAANDLDGELRLRTFEPQFGGVVDLDKRPEWLKKETKRVSEFQYAVSAGPFDDSQQCQIALLDELERSTGDFINSYLGSQFASKFIHFDGVHIRDRLVAETYDETVHPTTGDADMTMVHALVDYNSEFRGEIQERWRQWQATSRLAKGGLIAGGVLLMLGILFSYFRLDTSTRGFYSGRLQFFTAVAILGLIAVGVLFARSSVMWLPF